MIPQKLLGELSGLHRNYMGACERAERTPPHRGGRPAGEGARDDAFGDVREVRARAPNADR